MPRYPVPEKQSQREALLAEARARIPDQVDAIRAKRRTPRGDEIESITKDICDIWARFPQYRLVRMCLIALREDGVEQELRFVEDDQLLRSLRRFHEKWKKKPSEAPKG